MTTYIPDSIHDDLSKIGHAVAMGLMPNKEFDLNLKDAIAKDPTLAEHLSDLEHQAPGTLARLGAGPNAVRAISALPPSQKFRSNELAIQGQQNQNILQGQDITLNASKIADDAKLATIIQSGVKPINADDIIKGTTPTDDQIFLLDHSPGARDALNLQVQFGEKSLAEAGRNSRALFRLQGQEQLRTESLAKAQDLMVKWGAPATLPLVHEYIMDEESHARGQYLMDHPSEAKSSKDAQLAAIAGAEDRYNKSIQSTQQGKAQVTIDRVRGQMMRALAILGSKRIKLTPDEQKTAVNEIAGYNKTLQSLGENQGVSVEWGVLPRQGINALTHFGNAPEGIVFKADGKPYAADAPAADAANQALRAEALSKLKARFATDSAGAVESARKVEELFPGITQQLLSNR